VLEINMRESPGYRVRRIDNRRGRSKHVLYQLVMLLRWRSTKLCHQQLRGWPTRSCLDLALEALDFTAWMKRDVGVGVVTEAPRGSSTGQDLIRSREVESVTRGTWSFVRRQVVPHY
jgi:hypothetical protein